MQMAMKTSVKVEEWVGTDRLFEEDEFLWLWSMGYWVGKEGMLGLKRRKDCQGIKGIDVIGK